MKKRLSKLAYDWQTAFGNKYPTAATGDPVAESTVMRVKYGHYFASCPD
jgi:hypothetical protein